MKVWLETDSYDEVILHWSEPSWDPDLEQWVSTVDTNEMYEAAAKEYFRLKRLPDFTKRELFEIDLSNSPKLTEIWVPNDPN